MITTVGETNADLARSKRLLKTDEDRLKEACQGFESLLTHKMMQTMRSATMDGGFLKKNNMEKFFTDMLDQELAESASKNSRNGIADILFNSLKHTLGGQELAKTDQLRDTSLGLQQNTDTEAMLESLKQKTMGIGDIIDPRLIDSKYKQAVKNASGGELERESINGYITKEIEKGAVVLPDRLPFVKPGADAHLIELRQANRADIW